MSLDSGAADVRFGTRLAVEESTCRGTDRGVSLSTRPVPRRQSLGASMSIEVIPCKDCLTPFAYATEAAEADRRRGRTPPERCAACREKHRTEYQTLGVSHNDVLQLRSDGSGGLARYSRQRPPIELRPTKRLAIEPMPIE